MSEPFSISDVEIRGAAALIRVRGRLDPKTAEALKHRCLEIRDHGHPNLAINLAGVSFVASSGAGTLLAITREFKKSGGSVRLVELSSAVRMVVDLLNLQTLLTIDGSETEGLQALGA